MGTEEGRSSLGESDVTFPRILNQALRVSVSISGTDLQLVNRIATCHRSRRAQEAPVRCLALIAVGISGRRLAKALANCQLEIQPLGCFANGRLLLKEGIAGSRNTATCSWRAREWAANQSRLLIGYSLSTELAGLDIAGAAVN